MLVGHVEGGARDVVGGRRRRRHHAREAVEDQTELRLDTLDELEVADDALRPHLLRRQLAVAIGELERVGGDGEAPAAEESRALATEELGHVLASGLDDLLRHGQRESAPLAVTLELETGKGGGAVIDLDLAVERGLERGDGGVGGGGAVDLGDHEVVNDGDHASLAVLTVVGEHGGDARARHPTEALDGLVEGAFPLVAGAFLTPERRRELDAELCAVLVGHGQRGREAHVADGALALGLDVGVTDVSLGQIGVDGGGVAEEQLGGHVVDDGRGGGDLAGG